MDGDGLRTLLCAAFKNRRQVLVKGKPATVHSIPEQGEPITLTGERILMDQDSRVVWLDGAADRHAVAAQGKTRIEGVQVLLIQKSAVEVLQKSLTN